MDFSNLFSIEDSNTLITSSSLFNLNQILKNTSTSNLLINNNHRLNERESSSVSTSSSMGDLHFAYPSISKQVMHQPVQSHQQSLSDRKKLFVGNLPTNTTLKELIDLFSKFGPVNEELSVVKDDNYAFIHFISESDAEMAYRELNDSFFKNRYIRVQYSTSRGHIKKTRSNLFYFLNEYNVY
jgi:RNA recognition motif-containing protein